MAVWVAAGATYELTWDAREAHPVYENLDCANIDTEADPPTPMDVLRPVEPGPYRIDVYAGTAASLPEECYVDQDGVSCSDGSYYGPGVACPWLDKVSTPFTLPETGDLTVDIELS